MLVLLNITYRLIHILCIVLHLQISLQFQHKYCLINEKIITFKFPNDIFFNAKNTIIWLIYDCDNFPKSYSKTINSTPNKSLGISRVNKTNVCHFGTTVF